MLAVARTEVADAAGQDELVALLDAVRVWLGHKHRTDVWVVEVTLLPGNCRHKDTQQRSGKVANVTAVFSIQMGNGTTHFY